MTRMFTLTAALLAIGLLSANADAKTVKCVKASGYGTVSQVCKDNADDRGDRSFKETAKPGKQKPAPEPKNKTAHEA